MSKKKGKRLKPIWKKAFCMSAIFFSLITYISSLQVKAEYVPGTLTQIAKLQHIDLSNPQETKKLIVNYKAGQENISAKNINFDKTKVKVITPTVANIANIETAKVNVSIQKKSNKTEIDNKNKINENGQNIVQSMTKKNENINSTAINNKNENHNTDNAQQSLQTTRYNVENNNKTEDIVKNETANTEQDEISSKLSSTASLENTKPKDLTLNLATDEITIWNGNAFNPESFISSLSDENNTLPNLQIENTVDTKKDGNYKVTYKVISSSGKKIKKELIVKVKTPDEIIQRRIEENKRKEEAEKAAREAEQEKAQQQAEQTRIQNYAINKINLNIGQPVVDPVGASLNPYQIPNGYWSNCTWGAWQLVYQNEGIRLPHFGNASEWYYDAIAAGYSVDSNPRVGDVAVYGGGNGLGHVAYVAQVSADGNNVYVLQGNYGGGYTEKWNSRYSTSISEMPLLGYIHVR